jgi:hypothetical protein
MGKGSVAFWFGEGKERITEDTEEDTEEGTEHR